MRNPDGTPDEVDGFNGMVSDLANDGACDPLDTGTEDVRVILIASALSFLGFLHGNPQGARQDQIQMMAAAGLVIERNDDAVRYDADARRTATDIDDHAVVQSKQSLGRSDLIDQLAAPNARIFQDVATGSRFGLRYSWRKRGRRCSNFSFQNGRCRSFELPDSSDRVREIDDNAIAHGLAGEAVPVDGAPLPVYSRQNDRRRSEINTKRQGQL
ncbi:hypothetical protein NLN62_03035 [Bradyrhizobium sp. CCGUVB23]|nr:hypothetical protein [Bradyrhizobium sp. CCGUVB23]MCP3459367.1 hypothetical protein [Bradyrhizobium sp. CCGUVB23]